MSRDAAPLSFTSAAVSAAAGGVPSSADPSSWGNRLKTRDAIVERLPGRDNALVQWGVCEEALWAVLEQVQVLGTGSYGTVYLVRFKSSAAASAPASASADRDALFALKVFDLPKPKHVDVSLYELMVAGMLNQLARVEPPCVPSACLLHQAFVCLSPEKTPVRVAAVMELASGTLRELVKGNLSDDDLAVNVDNAAVQTLLFLLSIALTYDMLHHDLYPRNVFYFDLPAARGMVYRLPAHTFRLRTARLFTPADLGFGTTPELHRAHDSLSRGSQSATAFFRHVSTTATAGAQKRKRPHILQYGAMQPYMRDVASLLTALPRTKYTGYVLHRVQDEDTRLRTPAEFATFVHAVTSAESLALLHPGLDVETDVVVGDTDSADTLLVPRDARAEVDLSFLDVLLDCRGACRPVTCGPPVCASPPTAPRGSQTGPS